MRPLTLALITAALALGCASPSELFDHAIIDARYYHDCSNHEGDEWTLVWDNPAHCGACGNDCPAGVPCVGTACQFDTVLHCGEADRRCVAAGDQPRAVSCVAFGEDETPPDGVEVIKGHGCVALDPPPRVVVGGDGEPEIVELPKLDGVRWLTVPGHAAACDDGLDANACATAVVEYTDACAEPITERFAYDFAIMTSEMSRGQFREVMCDCDAPEFEQCIALCDEEKSPNAALLADMPMTGVNWCEAYTACQRMGARLPTVRERAVLEAQATTPRSLFEAPMSCGEWALNTRRVPWVAECLNQPTDDLYLDRVKGEAGRVFVVGGALKGSEPLHHLPDNVAEWMADPVTGLTEGASGAEGPAWGLPMSAVDFATPRMVRGRSLHSPAGQPGAQLIAVEASVAAEDLGLRCAATIDSPYNMAMPYDATIDAEFRARCDQEPVGLRPVRQSIGEKVFRATDICVDSDRDLPADFRQKLIGRGYDVLVRNPYFGPLARRSSGGDVLAIGPARFAMDEQWWLAEPAHSPGERIGFRAGDMPLELEWTGEDFPHTSACMSMAADDPSTEAAWERVVRRHAFILSRDDVWLFDRFGVADACAHLDCADAGVEADACEADCPGWILPWAIAFAPVEPGSTRFCR